MRLILANFLPRNLILKISVNFFWSLLSIIASKGSILLASIFIAKVIGKSAFGQLGIIQSTIVMFGSFAMFGISMTITKYVAEFSSTNLKLASRIIRQFGVLISITGIAFSLVLFLSSFWISKIIFNSPELSIYLKFCSILIFTEAILGYISAILYGLHSFKQLAKINSIVGVISFISLIGFTQIYKINGTIFALILNGILSLLINFYFLNAELKRNNISWYLEIPFNEIKIFLNFTVPAFLSSLMITSAYWISNSFLVQMTKSFDEVAIFNAANQWRVFIVFIPATLGSVILPLLSSYIGNESSGLYSKTFNVSLFITIIISLGMAIPLLIFSPWIMQNYGPGFKQGYLVLDTIALSGVLMCINNVIGMSIVAKGFLWFGFLLNLFWAAALIGFSYFFINKGYGALGIALSTLFAYFLHTIFQLIFIKKNRINR